MQREKVVWKKKSEDSEKLFFKALANRFWLTTEKVIHGSTKLFEVDLLSNGLNEKVNYLLLKVY